jgi:hypothetical protein
MEVGFYNFPNNLPPITPIESNCRDAAQIRDQQHVDAKTKLPPARGEMRAEERENREIRSHERRCAAFRGDFRRLLERAVRDAVPHPPLLWTVLDHRQQHRKSEFGKSVECEKMRMEKRERASRTCCGLFYRFAHQVRRAPHFHCPRTELRPHGLLRPRSREGASHRRSCSSALPADRGWQPRLHDFAGLFTDEHPLGMPAPSLPFQLCKTKIPNPSVSYLYSDLGSAIFT